METKMKTFKSIKMLSVVVTVFFLLGGVGFATPITADDGTEANPAISFESDLDTGLWRMADNILYISTGGVARARFDNSGLYMTVMGSAAAPTIRMDDPDTGFYRSGVNHIGVSAGGSQILDIGNMGLYIYDGSLRTPNGDDNTPGMAFMNDSNTGMFLADADEIGFSTGGSEAMRIDPSGNVGIGKTSQLFGKLDIQATGSDDSHIMVSATGTGQSGIFFDAANGDFSGSDYLRIVANDDLSANMFTGLLGGNLSFWAGSNSDREQLVLNTDGNVGIGVAPSSGEKLEVNGSVKTTYLNVKTNNSAGYAGIEVGAGSGDGKLSTYGPDHPDSSYGGAFRPDSFVIRADDNLSGGLSLVSDNPNAGAIRFYTGGISNGNKRMELNNNELIIGVNIKAKDISVKTDVWSDYVFEDDYKLPSLEDVETHIKEKKHLPEIPSAKEIEEDGLNMAEMMALQMKKIEELTLYMIEMKKENIEMKKENEQLKARLDTLEKVN